MTNERKVIDAIGIMIDRNSLTFEDLKDFVSSNKDVRGVLELNHELSDHEYKVWELVVYEDS